MSSRLTYFPPILSNWPISNFECFDFVLSSVHIDISSKLVVVPPDIESKEELFSVYSTQLNFPDYFGANWDALLDCLRDLSWIKESNIFIEHAGLPLEDSPLECETYLQVLKSAMGSWNEDRLPSETVIPENWEYVEHKLIVRFPKTYESKILELGANS